MTKSAHFLSVNTTYSTKDYARLYSQELVRIHGAPVSIISGRGAQFTAQFWKSFKKGLGSKVNLSIAFHPQTDGQAEHIIQTLEDMLRVCVDTPKTQGEQLDPNAKTRARADPAEPFATSAGSHTQSRKQISISRLKIKPSAGKAPINRSIK
ncbi:hypothetical protein MTR67_022898 [Solanum verrucosum]|uniref:Integrase catalytic domain-containing protein n=1 Tax=Solanum verrucosum TaxID=315347 RepID=A0AAF0TY91_SOLVR|nr:hypothetical protein MTR67_022898 [Solanum verrucosum]